MKNTLSDRLNYLTTIAEEQSITRAATRLFISQPALTAFLSRTEEELGTRLPAFTVRTVHVYYQQRKPAYGCI